MSGPQHKNHFLIFQFLCSVSTFSALSPKRDIIIQTLMEHYMTGGSEALFTGISMTAQNLGTFKHRTCFTKCLCWLCLELLDLEDFSIWPSPWYFYEHTHPHKHTVAFWHPKAKWDQRAIWPEKIETWETGCWKRWSLKNLFSVTDFSTSAVTVVCLELLSSRWLTVVMAILSWPRAPHIRPSLGLIQHY